MSAKQKQSSNAGTEHTTTLGVYVELTVGEHAGTRILCRPWGFDHIGNNLETIHDLIADVLEAVDIAGAPGDDEGPSREQIRAVTLDTVRTSWNRVRQLIADSLENGDQDIEKIAGFADAFSIIEGVVDANGVFEAVGKAQAFGNRMPHVQKMQQAAAAAMNAKETTSS